MREGSDIGRDVTLIIEAAFARPSLLECPEQEAARVFESADYGCGAGNARAVRENITRCWACHYLRTSLYNSRSRSRSVIGSFSRASQWGHSPSKYQPPICGSHEHQASKSLPQIGQVTLRSSKRLL